MPQQIRAVAVVGCGVIGMSWASLFLARGLEVIITDPAEGVEDAFRQFLHDAWPALQGDKAVEQVLAENCEFVKDITPRLPEVDFIQEVT
jgi:3-hydroxyacyl-CoA dehydrogenase